MSRSVLSRALVLAAALSAIPATASAANPQVLPTARESLRSAAAQPRDCTQRAPRDARGVTTRSWTAPKAGFVTARLHGTARSDWDLALVDRKTGDVLNASAAFGANEQATSYVSAGQDVVVQACRRKGPDTRVPLTISAVAVSLDRTPERISLVEVHSATPADFDRLRTLGFDLTDHSDGKTQHALLHGVDDARRLRAEGYAFRTLIPDVVEQDAADRAAERRNQREGMPSGRTTYRTLANYQNELKALAEENPSMVRPVTLPVKSYDGRDITGIEIATDVHRTDDGRPVYLQMGIHHAREWPAGEAPMEFAYDLIKNPTGDKRFDTVRDRARTYVIPVLNVDGFNASRTPGSFPNDDQPATPGTPQQIIGGVAYRRKNCRPAPGEVVPCPARQYADLGVDPNRNYGQEWGGAGTSDSENSLTYRGAGPFSEPETQAIRQLLLGLQPIVSISNHTFTGLMLRPPGIARDGPAPDEDRMRVLGDAMADATDYTSQYGYQLYDTTGTSDDWIYGVLNAYAYTPEIGKINFHPSYPHTVREYEGYELEEKDGSTRRLGGLREAFVLAGLTAIDPDSHSILEGTAPAGRILRLQRDTITTTSPVEDDGETPRPVEILPEHRETTLTVPADGRFEWHVNPSHRPRETNPMGAWTLTCEDQAGQVLERREIFVARSQRLNLVFDCGGTAPTPPTNPGQPTQAEGCRDRSAPRSRFAARRSLRLTRRGIALSGTSADTGCGDSRVARVAVSIGRVQSATRCRFLLADGRLSSARSCRRTSYLPADGTTGWRLSRRVRLPRGEYKVWVRGYDAAGNIEKKDFRRNFVRLRVR